MGSAQVNRIRFSAVDGKRLVGQTDWLPEHTSKDAPAALAVFRQKLGGDYAYLIERTGDSKVPNPTGECRFRIKQGEDIYYSRLVQAGEKEAVLAEIRTMHPKAEITEEAI